MNIYIHTHSDIFLDSQKEFINKFYPEANVHIIATLNANKTIRKIANFRITSLNTLGAIDALLPLVGNGPGMIIEWDMIPIKKLPIINAVNVESTQYGVWPSVLMWEDKSSLNLNYQYPDVPFSNQNWTPLYHTIPIPECSEYNHFVIIGDSFLHYHHLAEGEHPSLITEERLECWKTCVDYYSQSTSG